MEFTPKSLAIFDKLASKYNWLGDWRKQLTKLKNPNQLNPEIEFIEIDKYLMGFVQANNLSKVWRGKGWFQSLQNWFERTERFSLSREELLKPIDIGFDLDEAQDEFLEEESFYSSLVYCENLKEHFTYNPSWAEYVEELKSDLPEREVKAKEGGCINLGFFHLDLRKRLERKLLKIAEQIEEEQEKKEFIAYLLFVKAKMPAFLASKIFLEEDYQPEFDHCIIEEPPQNTMVIETLPEIEDPFVSLRELRQLFRNKPKNMGVL